ncbi:MAG TPA: hypothetical protein VH277_02915 [Gemmatimonadaceae bacterium]|nr:hypothetical protein [Gemmatimonadaceae bacterium]
MRFLWTLLKVIIALAIAIPVGIVAVGLALGILGTLFGLAILALKLACLGVIGYGLFRAARFFLAPAPRPRPVSVPELPARDSYYEAAMRELDSELGRGGR